MRRGPRQLGLLALLALSLAAGCGRPRSPRVSDGERKPPDLPTHTTFQQPTVTVKDRQGGWVFEVTAEKATSTGEGGPSDMTGARATYRRGNEPPVNMTADRLLLDQARQEVTLEGRVTLDSGAMRVEGDRLRYNLKTAKVEAARGTKWTFGPGATAPARARTVPTREKRS